MSKIITTLDIGSFETRSLLVKILPKEEPQIVGIGKVLSKGIKKGVVVDINEASETVAGALNAVQNSSGLKVGELLVGINGTNLSSVSAKGVVAVSRADRQITPNDVERVIKSAQATLAAPNREIITILSRGFSIDNEEGIRNPVGMNGVRLEAQTVIVSASSPFLRNLSKAVELSGWKGTAFIPGPLASGEALISKKFKELGVAVVDIGADTLSLAVYEDGEVLHVETLPIGSGLVTSDIAIGLRVDIDTAEIIKTRYGTVLPQEVRKTEVIDLRSLGVEINERIRRSEVAEIIEARMREIFALVAKSLQKVGKQNFLPAGVVLVGGGSKLEGTAEFAKNELKLPVRLGFPENFQGLIDEVTDPAFAKTAGLLMWRLAQGGGEPLASEAYTNKVGTFFQELFHRILP